MLSSENTAIQVAGDTRVPANDPHAAAGQVPREKSSRDPTEFPPGADRDPAGLPTGSRRENSWMSGLVLDPKEAGATIEFEERADVNARLRKVVGDRIVMARGLSGYSQGECAAAVGWANPTQQNLIELGKRLPPVALLARFSEVLGVSTDFILGLESEPDRDPKQAAKRAVLRQVRGLLEQTSCRITDAVFTHVRTEAAAGMASDTLLRAAETAVNALRSFCELNQDAFMDMRGGARLVRVADELDAAAADARRERQRHERALQLALQRAPASNDATTASE